MEFVHCETVPLGSHHLTCKRIPEASANCNIKPAHDDNAVALHMLQQGKQRRSLQSGQILFWPPGRMLEIESHTMCNIVLP